MLLLSICNDLLVNNSLGKHLRYFDANLKMSWFTPFSGVRFLPKYFGSFWQFWTNLMSVVRMLDGGFQQIAIWKTSHHSCDPISCLCLKRLNSYTKSNTFKRSKVFFWQDSFQRVLWRRLWFSARHDRCKRRWSRRSPGGSQSHWWNNTPLSFDYDMKMVSLLVRTDMKRSPRHRWAPRSQTETSAAAPCSCSSTCAASSRPTPF